MVRQMPKPLPAAALREIWEFLDEWDGPMMGTNAKENIPFFIEALEDLLSYLKGSPKDAPLPPRAE